METEKSKNTIYHDEESPIFEKAYFNEKLSEYIHPSLTSRFGWKISKELLLLLHSLLFSYGLIIENDYEKFSMHFWGGNVENINYIAWFGEATQLVYLFDLLIIYKCIPNHDGRRHKLITEHFCNNKGNSYKPKNLGVALNQISDKSLGIIEINDIFHKLIEGGLKQVNHQA